MTASNVPVARTSVPADGGRAALIRVLWALAVAGFVVPNAMVITYLLQHGHGLASYFAAWVDSLPAAQLIVDLGICSAAFLGWSAVDARRLGIRWWFTIPATFLVGLCFAIPLYLLHRERALVGSTRA